MTRFSLIALLAASSLIASTQAMEAHEIGDYHTQVFDMLGERYAVSKPESTLDVMMDVSEILASFCPKEDEGCESRAHALTLQGFHAAQNGPLEIDYPEDFDPKLKQHIDNIYSTIDLLDQDNLNEIVDTLTEIHENIKNADVENELHKVVAIGGSSIAIESTKLWHETFTNPNHPLHGVVVDPKGQNRNLQTIAININLDVVFDIIKNDITGAIFGTIQGIVLFPFIVVSAPVLPLVMFFYGTIASAGISLSINIGTPGGEDDDGTARETDDNEEEEVEDGDR